MASKFGGIPVDVAGSKFGGVPIEQVDEPVEQPTTQPVVQPQPVAPPPAIRQPSMAEMFDKYRAGEFNPSQSAAFMELMARNIKGPGLGEPTETRGFGVEEQSGKPADISGAIEESASTIERTGKLALEAAKNLPESTINVLNDIGKAFLSPIETASNIGDMALGLVQEFIPGEQRAEQKLEMVADHFKEKYGSLGALNRSIAEDPASVALDISAMLTGGGTLAAKIPAISKVGATVAEVGAAMDPVTALAKVSSSIAKPVGHMAGEVIGAATGAGPGAVKQALKGEGLTSESSGFVRGMRGGISGENVLHDTMSALGSVKERRGASYRKQLAEIAKDARGIDMRPIKATMIDLMDRYGIKLDADNNLDFSRSSLGRNAESDVTEIIQTVSEWGTKQGDNTAIGLDILKRRLDDFYSDSKSSRAMVTEVRNKVKDSIVDNVPEYAKMTKEYEELSKMTNEMERALSLNNRAMMDTSIKKLTSTMRENFEFRRNLLDELEDLSGRSLSQEIAGLTMGQVIPKGLVGKLAAGGAAASGVVSPWLVPMAALTSPRLMGEFLNAAGFTARQAKKATTQLKKTGAFSQKVRQSAAITERAEENK